MIVVHQYGVGVLLCFLSMLCWGSWANAQKLVKNNWPFQLFYWDFPIGIVLLSLIAGLTLGSLGDTGISFIDSLLHASTESLAKAFMSGIIFNLSNILLVAAIDLAGMAVAFPLAVGLALVIGVFVNFLANPGGSAGFLFSGVTGIVIAMIFTGIAYGLVQKRSANIKKGLAISIAAGVLMGFFYRFLAASIGTSDGSLTLFSANFVFAIGIFISNFLFNTWMMKKPLIGSKVAFKDYMKKGAPHWAGILGGVIWGLGLTFSLMASSSAGYAISYGLSQGATLVAAFWGVFIWREFKGTALRSINLLIIGMFVFYLVGLGLIILAR